MRFRLLQNNLAWLFLLSAFPLAGIVFAQVDPVGHLANSARDNGLGVTLSILIAVFLGWLLKYVLNENSKREERLIGFSEKHIDTIAVRLTEHDTSSKQAIVAINEAHKRQREEHEVLITESKKQNDILNKIAEKLSDISCAKG